MVEKKVIDDLIQKYNLYVKKMEKMKDIAEYIKEHAEEELTAEIVAEQLGYNKKYFESIFAEYFEMPFHRYFKKYRLRKAAEVLEKDHSVKNEWKRYGFNSNVSFSAGFKKEFGISPREFIDRGLLAPSMPDKKKLFGIPIRVGQGYVDTFDILGYPIRPINGNETDLLEDAAYALDHEDAVLDPYDIEDCCGVWWYDFENTHDLYYLVGREKYEEKILKDRELTRVHVEGDYYSVFSYKRLGDPKADACMSRLLVRYALLEWKLTSFVKPNNMGWTFERFGKEYNYLYVPIKAKSEDDKLLIGRGQGVDTWTNYIDKHICKQLTLSVLADKANYTVQSYRRIFTMYYAIDPMSYVRKRRLYQAAADIGKLDSTLVDTDSHQKRIERIAEKYFYSSYRDFCELFEKEFQVSPEDYGQVNFGAIDLNQFYRQNKENLKLTPVCRDDLYFVGKKIKAAEGEPDYLDISNLAAFWFKDSFDDIPQRIQEYKGAKAAIWDAFQAEDGGEVVYEYMLGPVVEEKMELFRNDFHEPYKFYHLKGGKYIVFETLSSSDKGNLTNTFRTLTRCAFFGWYRENLYRSDGERLTFVIYENEKLYFYVPVNG